MRMKGRFSIPVLALILVCTLFAGCEARGGSSSSGGGSSSVSSSRGSSSWAPSESGGKQIEAPDYLEDVERANEINSDTVGWLHVSGLPIDDVVVWNSEDNNYYWRRTFTRAEGTKEAFDGVFYADRRSKFGDGSREQLGVNTCIYGHAMTDNPEKDRYAVKFGPLHDLRKPEYAQYSPYIYFSTEKENFVFEIIAVFTVNADDASIPYNYNPADQAAFVKMVEEKILPRSKYDYGVTLKPTDKFLTLSTCIYTMDNGYVTNYPDTYMRYGVMARLLEPGAVLKSEATFNLRQNVIIDKDGRVSSK